MIRVRIDELMCGWSAELQAQWAALMAAADTERERVLLKWETSHQLTADDFNSQVWRNIRAFLVEHVFDNKCAYCQADREEVAHPPHAEHFRPKGEVKAPVPAPVGNGEVQPIELCRSEGDWVKANVPDGAKHPGYFWLVYDWENLLPSCYDCNSSYKRTYFPVENDYERLHVVLDADQLRELKACPHPSPTISDAYYLRTPDLDARERPLLLHPYYDDPAEHLKFCWPGLVVPREIDGELSARGCESMRVYGLHRAGLRSLRRLRQETAYNRARVAFDSSLNDGASPGEARQAARDEIANLVSDDATFSAAQLAVIDEFYFEPGGGP